MWGPAPPSVHCRAWRASRSLDRVFWKLTPTARGTDKETVPDFRAVLKPTTRDYDFGGRNWDVMILMRHRWGCWVKGRGCLSLGRKLRWFTSKFRVMFPEDWLGFVSLNIFAHTKGKKPIIPVLFYDFCAFQTSFSVFPPEPAYGLFAKVLASCLITEPTPALLLMSLWDKQSPFIILPLPGCLKPSTNQSHLLLFALHHSFKPQNSPESGC